MAVLVVVVIGQAMNQARGKESTKDDKAAQA
jgi:hypothetical protein